MTRARTGALSLPPIGTSVRLALRIGVTATP